MTDAIMRLTGGTNPKNDKHYLFTPVMIEDQSVKNWCENNVRGGSKKGEYKSKTTLVLCAELDLDSKSG